LFSDTVVVVAWSVVVGALLGVILGLVIIRSLQVYQRR